jgi:hypothetical protein
VIASTLDVFVPELAWLDVAIRREMLRLRARYELSLDEFRGLYITDERVDSLVGRDLQSIEFSPDYGRPATRNESDPESRWCRLATALGLTDDERAVLLVCLAPELDPKYETLYAYLNDDVSRKHATADLAARLLARDASHRAALRRPWLPDAPLIACGAIEPIPTQRDLPRATRGVRVVPALANWLLGLPYVDERLDGAAHLAAVRLSLPDAAIPESARSSLARAVHWLQRRTTPPSPLLVTASSASEARLIAEHLHVLAGRRPLLVDLEVVRSQRSSTHLATAIELAQRVMSIGAIVSPLDAAIDADGRTSEEIVPFLRQLISRSPGVVIAGSPHVRWVEFLPDVQIVEVQVPELRPTERAALWRWALEGDTPAGGPIDDEVVTALADRFALSIDRILRAVEMARTSASLGEDRRLTRAELFAAARAVSISDSVGTVRPIVTPFDWNDLILPVDSKQQLADIVHAIEMRARVLDDWGFAKTIATARGIKVLFAGPSGTGKTMAAGIIARTLGLELQRLELGATVSKYIGETEKNLDRAFGSARRSNAILFIDEADALFGKRSEVKDAHDRYANVEIAYLLQKMEDHDGIVILATNLAKNIDEAFSRRMQFVVEFPLPDVECRERLWRGMFPVSAPVDDSVDNAYLARQFELTGGDIRNIVLDAAFHAAQNDEAITLPHVLRAIAQQFAKTGRVPTPADFREHYRLLAQRVPEVG